MKKKNIEENQTTTTLNRGQKRNKALIITALNIFGLVDTTSWKEIQLFNQRFQKQSF